MLNCQRVVGQTIYQLEISSTVPQGAVTPRVAKLPQAMTSPLCSTASQGGSTKPAWRSWVSETRTWRFKLGKSLFGYHELGLWYEWIQYETKISWSVLICNLMIFTSSAAQGGGRSFKNRKPIGEVGCCESGMAERSH